MTRQQKLILQYMQDHMNTIISAREIAEWLLKEHNYQGATALGVRVQIHRLKYEIAKPLELVQLEGYCLRRIDAIQD